MPIKKLTLSACSLAMALAAGAQDVHFPPFEATPLFLNPALTGMFNGKLHVAAIYNNQWSALTVPYLTAGLSLDMPVLIRKHGYWAVGGYAMHEMAGDGTLKNFNANISAAYHRYIGKNCELAIGAQGGYVQKAIDLTNLYFDSLVSPLDSASYVAGLGNSINFYTAGVGATFSHSVSQKVNYIVGISAGNTRYPIDVIRKDPEGEYQYYYKGIFGANLLATTRFTFHPAALIQVRGTCVNIVAGNEFHYNTLGSVAFFLGGYYRTGDITNITAGVITSRFRFGLAYDYNLSNINTASNGKGGVALSVRYTTPDFKKLSKQRFVPCNRF